MRSLVVTTVVVLLVVTGGAAAKATPSAELPAAYDRWIAEMRVPSPPWYEIRAEPCPETAPGWSGEADCTWPSGPVFVQPVLEADFRLSTRFDLYHELGHQFDYQLGTHRLRQRFRHVARMHGRWVGLMAERFADAYALCAFPRRTEREEWTGDEGIIRSDGYDYRARWRSHRRFCALLRKVSVRTGNVP